MLWPANSRSGIGTATCVNANTSKVCSQRLSHFGLQGRWQRRTSTLRAMDRTLDLGTNLQCRTAYRWSKSRYCPASACFVCSPIGRRTHIIMTVSLLRLRPRSLSCHRLLDSLIANPTPYPDPSKPRESQLKVYITSNDDIEQRGVSSVKICKASAGSPEPLRLLSTASLFPQLRSWCSKVQTSAVVRYARHPVDRPTDNGVLLECALRLLSSAGQLVAQESLSRRLAQGASPSRSFA